MRIVVLGYIIKGPLGGLAWHHLQYVLGLKNLGHQVLFIEDSEEYPACYNPVTFQMSEDPTYGLLFCNHLFSTYNMKDDWCYFDFHTNKWFGKGEHAIKLFCKSADVVINLSGINPLREWWTSIPIRMLVDTDPAFTQIKHLTNAGSMQVAKAHTHYVTYGENFGKMGCSIPDDGLDWQPTRQPVVNTLWDDTYNGNHGNWSTVMQWDSYKTGEHNGTVYGMKSASFSAYEDLPSKVADTMEIALGSQSAPYEMLKSKGWKISNPLDVTITSKKYQEFIRQSKGEWSIAKHGYVISNSGWFSERSAAYLASGKPVVVQDTGFSNFLPTGKGLFAFTSPEEAVAAIAEVNKDYEYHCKQARAFIEEHFESSKVLNSLLSNI